MGIEPTNKGFADHLSKHCKLLILNALILDSLLLGPGLGPTLLLVPHWLLGGQYRPSRAGLANKGGGRRRICPGD